MNSKFGQNISRYFERPAGAGDQPLINGEPSPVSVLFTMLRHPLRSLVSVRAASPSAGNIRRLLRRLQICLRNFGGLLRNFGGRPRNFGGRLRNFGGRPRNFGGRLRNFGGRPRNFGRLLRNFGGRPRNSEWLCSGVARHVCMFKRNIPHMHLRLLALGPPGLRRRRRYAVPSAAPLHTQKINCAGNK